MCRATAERMTMTAARKYNRNNRIRQSIFLTQRRAHTHKRPSRLYDHLFYLILLRLPDRCWLSLPFTFRRPSHLSLKEIVALISAPDVSFPFCTKSDGNFVFYRFAHPLSTVGLESKSIALFRTSVVGDSRPMDEGHRFARFHQTINWFNDNIQYFGWWQWRVSIASWSASFRKRM